MKKSLIALVTSIVCCICAPAFSATVPTIGMYVTPYYDSTGPKINVGPFSDALATADEKSIDDVIQAMSKARDSLPAEAMFVAAIRLHDLGHRDEAVVWFYDAQYRGRLLHSLLDSTRADGMGSLGFELSSALGAFQQLAGPAINGYAGCDIDKWLAAIEMVRELNKELPDFAEIYPSLHLLSQDEWSAKNKGVDDGLGEFVDYIKNNRAEIAAGRKKNDADARYCGA